MLEGKVVASIFINKKYLENSVTVNFKDGSHLVVELDFENTSCHCHPENDYFITMEAYDSETGKVEKTEVRN